MSFADIFMITVTVFQEMQQLFCVQFSIKLCSVLHIISKVRYKYHVKTSDEEPINTFAVFIVNQINVFKKRQEM